MTDGSLSYDLPDIEGVTMHLARLSAIWRKPEGSAILVPFLSGTAEIGGYRDSYQGGLVAVTLDTAHDLSWQGPSAYVYPDGVDWQCRWRGRIEVLGFTETEALDAFDAVRAAIRSCA